MRLYVAGCRVSQRRRSRPPIAVADHRRPTPGGRLGSAASTSRRIVSGAASTAWRRVEESQLGGVPDRATRRDRASQEARRPRHPHAGAGTTCTRSGSRDGACRSSRLHCDCRHAPRLSASAPSAGSIRAAIVGSSEQLAARSAGSSRGAIEPGAGFDPTTLSHAHRERLRRRPPLCRAAYVEPAGPPVLAWRR